MYIHPGPLKKVATKELLGVKVFKLPGSYDPKSWYVDWDRWFSAAFWYMVQHNVEPCVIATYDSEKDHAQDRARTQLGNSAVIKLAHLFEILDQQSKGEEGLLLTNGQLNIAHMKNEYGNAHPVSFYWIPLCITPGYWRIRTRLDAGVWIGPCRFLAYDA